MADYIDRAAGAAGAASHWAERDTWGPLKAEWDKWVALYSHVKKPYGELAILINAYVDMKTTEGFAVDLPLSGKMWTKEQNKNHMEKVDLGVAFVETLVGDSGKARDDTSFPYMTPLDPDHLKRLLADYLEMFKAGDPPSIGYKSGAPYAIWRMNQTIQYYLLKRGKVTPFLPEPWRR